MRMPHPFPVALMGSYAPQRLHQLLEPVAFAGDKVDKIAVTV
jgi:hypothetical protein